jgi:gluconokinase
MIVVVMGVSGSGKTAVGEILARELGWPYLDADDYHPPANVEKMRSGHPLTDDDRWPWLDRLNELMLAQDTKGRSAVVGCSALKQIYRDRLTSGLTDVRWVHLTGGFDLIMSRLQTRKHRYMPASLLQSQFDTLEPPQDALTIDISDPPQVLAERIRAGLGLPV